MRYIYPKTINLSDISIKELTDKYIIKNNSFVNIYGIITKLEDCEIIKEYNDYKILFKKSNLKIYDDYLSHNINNYKNVIKNNEIKIINSDKIKNYYENKKNDLYLIIHYVKKSGFLNIPKISIL